VLPLYLPEDRQVVRGIREIAGKGGAKNADHTLNNVEAFISWRKKLADATAKKPYFPELKSTISGDREQLNRTSHADRAAQLQETYFVDV
jgi:trimethylamine---corrinoid protein Co-methyltransferase